MSELTVSQIIKLVLGALVIVAVAVGLYFAFKENIFGFFKGVSNSTSLGFWRGLWL